jgi:hypothetical protein
VDGFYTLALEWMQVLSLMNVAKRRKWEGGSQCEGTCRINDWLLCRKLGGGEGASARQATISAICHALSHRSGKAL